MTGRQRLQRRVARRMAGRRAALWRAELWARHVRSAPYVGAFMQARAMHERIRAQSCPPGEPAGVFKVKKTVALVETLAEAARFALMARRVQAGLPAEPEA